MSGLKAFTMPKWGIEMEEGTVAEWMIGEGVDFARGDVLTLIETDKITNEYEAEFSGRLARVVVPSGETRPVGTLLAVFADAGATVDAAALDAFVAGYRPGGAAAGPQPAEPVHAHLPAAEASPAPAPVPTPAANPSTDTAGLKAFTMPKWGIEMEQGTVAEWMVKDGDDFARGHLLTLIETDKITNEYEAEFAGRIARIVVPAGDTQPVGALLAVFTEANALVDPAAVDAFVAGYCPGGAAASADASPAPAQAASQTAAFTPQAVTIPDGLAISPAARHLAEQGTVEVTGLQGTGRDGRITLQDVVQAGRPAPAARSSAAVDITPTTAFANVFATPLARRLAALHGIDLGGITGTGRAGRIGKADVLTKVVTKPNPPSPAPAPLPAIAPPSPPPPAAAGVEVVRMSAMRKAIARQLGLSKSTIPHFYLRNSARIDALTAMRAQAKRATGEAPSINDYLIRAVALALKAHPDVNIQVHGDEIHRFPTADVAVAVATDKGLLTPIVRAADTKSVAAISTEVKSLAARARAGKLAAEEFQGGSFSVSNLGMFGIEQFDAIINPPQGAILAVGASRQETMAIDHAIAFATRIRLSLSCDHRAIDGAVGARFLAELTRLIETPEELTA